MIAQTDPWKSAPRIGRDHFAAIIRTRGNHDLAFERDPGEYWDAISGYGIDPLFLLAMFNHESNMGVNGTAVQTHSWGNTRDPSFGVLPVGATPGRSGTFPIFRDWLDGCISTAARLVEPTWYYHDRPDIGSIFVANGPVWAPAGDLNDPAGYLRSVLDFMNANADGGSRPMPRIIVSAGHENIGSITAVKIGQASADALRGGTGANGERAWTPLVADELSRLLVAAGADVVRTDAIYHDSAYADDADLVVALHYDGVGGTGRAQYCMAATVHSGPSTEAADARADVIVQEWYASYPQALHIAGNGPITDGMTQYYGGWYRTANTPMLLIEHCIGADGGGIRADRPTPQSAAAADFAVLAKHFGLGGHVPPASDKRTFPETGRSIAGNIKGFWERFGDDKTSIDTYGFPVTDLVTEDGLPVQYFERQVLEDHGGDVKGRRLGAAAAKAKGYSGPGI